MTEKDITMILQKVLDKEVLLKKSKECKLSLPDMEELALSIKTECKMKDIISNYLHKQFSEKKIVPEWPKGSTRGVP